jgi:hypothetical protein
MHGVRFRNHFKYFKPTLMAFANIAFILIIEKIFKVFVNPKN